mmetsp:Transcript_25762/g.71787  ORF Transcript_25762/g.71787 Transcript_25762/m.71787 type:complete len:227 (+) Transcript_25762:491-1171(+)
MACDSAMTMAAALAKAARSCFAKVAPRVSSSVFWRALSRALRAALNVTPSCSKADSRSRRLCTSSFNPLEFLNSSSNSRWRLRSSALNSLSGPLCSRSKRNESLSASSSLMRSLNALVSTSIAAPALLSPARLSSSRWRAISVSRRRFSAACSRLAVSSSSLPRCLRTSHSRAWASRSPWRCSTLSSASSALRFFALPSFSSSSRSCASCANAAASRLDRRSANSR